MPRGTKTSLRIQKYTDKATKSSRKALLSSLCEDMYKLYKKNGDRLPYGHITLILDRLKPTEPWLTRNVINKAFINHRKQEAAVSVVVVRTSSNSEISGLSNVSSCGGGSSAKWKVGRPVGSTSERKETNAKKIIKARNEAAKINASARKSAKKKMKRVPKGELKKIIAEVSKRNNVNVNNVSLIAIKRRVDRQSLECHHLEGGGQVSPLTEIETIVVGIILQMARIRQCLNPSKGLALVNSIIEGTKVQDDLKKWKQKNTPNSTGTVGKGYWRSFMKRYKNQIVSKRGAKYELNRQN